MVAEDVPGKANSRPEAGGVIVLVSRVAARWSETRDIQAFYAAAVNEWILAFVGEIRIEISNMAEVVVKTSKALHTKPEVQS